MRALAYIPQVLVASTLLSLAAMAAIVFGTFVIGGIAYTYENRPPEWLNAVAHLFDHRQLPADL
jgi:hypothetical protein